MGDQNQMLATSEMADRFITIANELSKTQTKDRVGMAFLFAAARYNAFVSMGIRRPAQGQGRHLKLAHR